MGRMPPTINSMDFSNRLCNNISINNFVSSKATYIIYIHILSILIYTYDMYDICMCIHQYDICMIYV